MSTHHDMLRVQREVKWPTQIPNNDNDSPYLSRNRKINVSVIVIRTPPYRGILLNKNKYDFPDDHHLLLHCDCVV